MKGQVLEKVVQKHAKGNFAENRDFLRAEKEKDMVRQGGSKLISDLQKGWHYKDRSERVYGNL